MKLAGSQCDGGRQWAVPLGGGQGLPMSEACEFIIQVSNVDAIIVVVVISYSSSLCS